MNIFDVQFHLGGLRADRRNLRALLTYFQRERKTVSRDFHSMQHTLSQTVTKTAGKKAECLGKAIDDKDGDKIAECRLYIINAITPRIEKIDVKIQKLKEKLALLKKKNKKSR